MGKIFSVEFQWIPSKLHTKFFAHTKMQFSHNDENLWALRFKSPNEVLKRPIPTHHPTTPTTDRHHPPHPPPHHHHHWPAPPTPPTTPPPPNTDRHPPPPPTHPPHPQHWPAPPTPPPPLTGTTHTTHHPHHWPAPPTTPPPPPLTGTTHPTHHPTTPTTDRHHPPHPPPHHPQHWPAPPTPPPPDMRERTQWDFIVLAHNVNSNKLDSVVWLLFHRNLFSNSCFLWVVFPMKSRKSIHTLLCWHWKPLWAVEAIQVGWGSISTGNQQRGWD